MLFEPEELEWIERIETRSVEGEHQDRTPADTETLLIVLAGTFDIQAGGGSWLARGIRKDPFEAKKPVALFLPPNTPFRFENGNGELLLASGRRPVPPPAPPEEKLAQKPLLPLAGSGKAFDPSSGEWKREEDFPDAPEAILPRRIEHLDCGAWRIFPFEYKARSLCLDEVVLAEGTRRGLPPTEVDGHPRERAIYYRTAGVLGCGSETLRGEGVITETTGNTILEAVAGAAYLAFVGAGAKLG